MTEPQEENLRQAMTFGAAEFSPAQPLGATRAAVLDRVHRRRRRTLSLSVAAVAAVAALAAATWLGGSGTSTSQRVASLGAGASQTPHTAAPPDRRAPPTSQGGSPAGLSSATTAASAGAPPHTTSVDSAPPASTVAPVRTVPTTAPSSATPATTPVLTTPTIPALSAVQGTVLFGPTCPVEQVPPNPACAPKPGAAHILLLRADGTTAAQGDAGADGQFRIPVAPGSYTVTATAVTPSPGGGCTTNPSQVTVAPGAEPSVAVSCDTGIR